MSQFLPCAMIRQDDGDCVGDKCQLDPRDVTFLCCGRCCDYSSRRCCLCSEEDWLVLITIRQHDAATKEDPYFGCWTTNPVIC